MADPLVHLLPSLDVRRAYSAPMRPWRDVVAEPPPVAQCADGLAQVVERLGACLEGQYVLAVHTGACNRDAFCREPFLESDRRARAQGAELAIHPHEEIRAKGTGHLTPDGMAGMIRLRMAERAAAGARAFLLPRPARRDPGRGRAARGSPGHARPSRAALPCRPGRGTGRWRRSLPRKPDLAGRAWHVLPRRRDPARP